MKPYNKEKIFEIIKAPELLKQEIIDSRGFVLYMADKYNIELPIELLMSSISEYSVRFLTEDMNKRQYSKDQIATIVEFLKEENDYYDDNESEKITSYSLENLLSDIVSEKDIPRNASSLLKLSFNDFLANQKTLSKLLDNSGDDYWRDYFNAEAKHPLLEPLFKKISKEDFLKIDKEILGSYPSFYTMAKHLMNEPEIKNSFNDSVDFYHNIPNIKSGGYKPRLENYRYYTFEKDEKELFMSLMKNEYTSDYERISRYRGFSNFFTKNEYILNYSVSSVQYLSKKEIADNVEKIRDGVVAAYFKPHYQNFEKLYQVRIEEDSFKTIFTKDFVRELVEKSNGFYFHYFDRDNQKKTNFMNITHKLVYGLCAEDEKILNMVGFQNIINDGVSLVEHNRQYFDNDYSVALQKILKNISNQLATDKLFENTNKNKIESYSRFDIPKIIIENMQGKESLNYLYMLMKITKEGNDWRNKLYLEEVNRVIPLINGDDVVLLAKNLNYKIDKKLLKDNIRQDYEQNFLNFNPEIIKKMSFNTFTEVFSLSKDFRDMVLKNDLDEIIIKETNKNRDERYRSDFIVQLLRSVDSKKSPYFDFIKKFIKKNKEFMVENYFSELVTHPVREDLIKIDTKELEINSYKNIEVLIDEFSTNSLEYDRLYAINDTLSKKEKKKNSEKIDKLSNSKTKLEEIINKELKNIGFDFYKNEIKNSDILKAIKLYSINSYGHRDTIYDKVESLDFETTKKMLDDKTFLNFVFSNKKDRDSNNDKEKRVFCLNPNFSEKQNIELVEIMLKNFNNPDLFKHRYNKKVPLSEVLSVIKKENRFLISNDLVVKHDPANMFNSYEYLPNESGFFERNVSKEFSTDQLIEAIENLNKKGKKIICISNQNLSHDNLLTRNYEHDHKKGPNPNLEEYLKLLQYLEKDPINYLACIHSDIVSNFIDKDKFEYLDIAKSDFYNKHINVDVVIDAMKEIFHISREFYASKDRYRNDEEVYGGIAIRSAIKSVSNFMSFTYYSDSRECVVISEFEEEKSKKILKTIMEEAPYLYFGTPYLGKLGSTSDAVTSNFKEYFTENMIDNFFINSSKLELIGEHFSIEYEKRKEYWQSTSADKFVHKLIEHLTNEKNSDDLYKLDFILKEARFNENERPYGKKIDDFSSRLAEFASNPEYEKTIEKALLFINLLSNVEKKEKKTKVKNKI